MTVVRRSVTGFALGLSSPLRVCSGRQRDGGRPVPSQIAEAVESVFRTEGNWFNLREVEGA